MNGIGGAVPDWRVAGRAGDVLGREGRRGAEKGKIARSPDDVNGDARIRFCY